MKFLNKIVYISGAISSDPDFLRKFRNARIKLLHEKPKLILDPTLLPVDWEYVDYMEHCMLMVRRADSLLMLPDWKNSPGAQAEYAYAVSLNKEIVYD